jgi:hypothetical protein
MYSHYRGLHKYAAAHPDVSDSVHTISDLDPFEENDRVVRLVDRCCVMLVGDEKPIVEAEPLTGMPAWECCPSTAAPPVKTGHTGYPQELHKGKVPYSNAFGIHGNRLYRSR